MESKKSMAKTGFEDDKLRPPPSPPPPMPWLIYTHYSEHNYDQKVQTFSTACFNNKAYLMSIPALREKKVIGSQFGWLILETHQFQYEESEPEEPDFQDGESGTESEELPCALIDITLYNPVTSTSIDLPQYKCVHWDCVCCCFTSTPFVEIDQANEHSNKCVLFIFYSGIAFWCPCPPHDDGTTSSSWFSKPIEIDGVPVNIKSTATIDGVIYCVGEIHTEDRLVRILLSIELVDGNGPNSFTFRPLPFTLPKRVFSTILNLCYEFMIVSCGRLYIAQVGVRKYLDVIHVKVFELDLEREIAVEIHSLGDRAFFLGSTYSTTWCWASSNCKSIDSVEGNCLYISHGGLSGDGVILYRLDGCTSTMLPCPKLKAPRKFNRIWLMPQIPPHHHSDRLLSVPCKCEKSFDKDEECEMLSQKTEIGGKPLPEIPLDLIELLAKKLHLFDCWSFRCASKAFHSVIPEPHWRSNNSFPLFIVFEDGDGLCRLIDPCRNDSCSCILRLSQHYFDINFSTDGWLLVSDATSLKLFNPFTRQMELLPYLDDTYSTMSFSIDPTSSKYLAVAITRRWSQYETNIYYLRSGEIEWNYCGFANSDYRFVYNHAKPIYHSGAFYFLSGLGYLGEFKIVEGQPELKVYDNIFTRHRKLHSCYLAECGEELLSVHIAENGKYFRVLQFNKINEKWVRVKSLGNFVLLMASNSSFWRETTDIKMRNRIYLPWLIGDRIVYYSLDTESYHVDGSEVSYKDFHIMKQPSRCCWF